LRAEHAGHASDEAKASPHAPYVLAMLFLVLILSLIDRNILGILVDDIKDDLGISDTRFGLLTGPAFALTNAIAGLPFARLADRWSRRGIIAWGLFAWSVLTALQGVTRTFGTLLATRVGVGIGEATTGPSAHSLIADYFPMRSRATALAIYTLGGHVGVWLAFLVGGWLSDTYSWRTALVVLGLPGVVLALLVGLTIKEPVRGAIEGRVDSGENLPLGAVLRVLFQKPTFRHLTMALPLFVCTSYSLNSWGPAFMMRVHGLTKTEIGLYFGMIVGLAGGAGSILGGVLSDRLALRDRRWYAWLPALANVVAVPFYAGFLFLPEPRLALLMLVPSVLLSATCVAPLWAANQAIAPLRMRATAYAVIHLGLSAISGGLAPLLVGVLNDAFTPMLGQEAVRYSLLLVVATSLWGALHALLAARRLPGDLATADAAASQLP
jgi:MFS family permease